MPGHEHPDERPPIVIVDADRRVRQSLADLLTLAGLPVVATAGTVAEALAVVELTQPTILLVDPRLPDVDAGAALVAAVPDVDPGVRVILMGWSDALEQPALLTRSDGYLPKGSTPEEFVAAALAVCGCEALA
jgi:DNA-binding NarL/FixJ family response regulator